MKDIAGIDLGTSSSALAVYDGERPTIVASTSQGKNRSSRVRTTEQKAQLSGAQGASTPFAEIVKALGRSFDAAVQDVPQTQEGVTPRNRSGVVMLTGRGGSRRDSADEIVAVILRRLKEEAESYLGRQLLRAVLTVPAHFDSKQRRAAERAATSAGLTILRVIDAPAAAALAVDHGHEKHQRFLVVDLDMGHLDVAVVELNEGEATILASDGDPALGHEAWADSIADHLAEAFLRRHGLDIRRDSQAILRLRLAAEEAGMQLLQADEAIIDLPFIASGAQGPLHLNRVLTRRAYAAQTAALRARLTASIEKTLHQAGVEKSLLDGILLLGQGAGGFDLHAVIGNVAEGIAVIEDSDREKAVLGAALYAVRAANGQDDMASSNVSQLGLGLETVGGLMTTMIPRGTPLPARRSEIFSTSEDDQTALEIQVLQGERPLAADNRRLGVVRLHGLPPAPRGTLQIEVTFEISAKGEIEVAARDLATGVSQALSVEAEELASDREARRLVAEAKTHEVDDLSKRAQVEVENLARQTIYQTSRYLQHLNSVSDRAGCRQARRQVEDKLGALREAVEDEDLHRIRSLTEDLQAMSNVLNQLAYGRKATAHGAQKMAAEHMKQKTLARIAIDRL